MDTNNLLKSLGLAEIGRFGRNCLGAAGAAIGRFARDKRGSMFAYVGVSLPVVIGFAGLGVDIAMWQLNDRRAQEMADSGAMGAGTTVMNSGEYTYINVGAVAGAALNGFDNTNPDHVINVSRPPSVGALSPAVYGDPDGDGIDGDDDSIEVTVTIPAPTFFSNVITTASRTSTARAVVKAVQRPANLCIMALDPNGAVTVGGTANIGLNCGALSNGDLVLNGGGCLTTTETLVSGTADSNGCSTSAAPSFPRPDPLRTLSEPSDRACNRTTVFTVTNSGTVVHLRAPNSDATAVFCNSIIVNEGGQLRMHPGVYVMHGGGFTINGDLDARGVMLYISEAATTSTSIRIAGTATVNWTAMAPSSLDNNSDPFVAGDHPCWNQSGGVFNGPLNATTGGSCALSNTVTLIDGTSLQVGNMDDYFEGIAVFVSRNVVTPFGVDFIGGADMQIHGIVYAPTSDVNWNGGSATAAVAVLGASVSASGNSNFGDLSGTSLPSILAYSVLRMVE